VDAEGLRPDACLAKVVAAARHFVEQVVGALPERAPERLCRKTVAVEQVAAEHVASEEGRWSGWRCGMAAAARVVVAQVLTAQVVAGVVCAGSSIRRSHL
jgi:hypothetical protein